ncbi:MAG: 16S rRNA (uracil(1498)-N(3))-methyltransferase [Rhizobiales bacterium]|nr:16S rRNA (uracil(1498)-N(3))-methyltransferase [Hyphomicrobiales bacterium]
MPYDFSSQRLFVRADLHAGAEIEAERGHANYLVNVLRLKTGDAVRLFNGRDGEWRARIGEASRKRCVLALEEQTQPQTAAPDLHYLFAPLKHARLDYMVQKAVEMGAGRLRPVITRHTQVSRVNLERMEANAIEAAEQCGILALPTIDEPAALLEVIAGWDPARHLIFCDESAPVSNPAKALRELSRGPAAVLIGPEGGFSADERDTLRRLPYVTALSLGPRILRADTAAVAALALAQAFIGDWR